MCLIFFNFLGIKSFPSVTIKQGGYVVATYDKCWYIGFVAEIDMDKRDVKVNFLQPKGPGSSFQFPKHNNVCWIPTRHILCCIELPNTSNNQRSI